MKKMKEKIFKIVGNNQKNPFRGNGTICNCLPAAMGMGGGYIPYIFLEIDDDDIQDDSKLKDNYVYMEEEKKIKTPRPEGKGWCWDENNGKWFRIRKLTPRECFRLMDVSDADFDKLLIMETTGKENKQKRVISDSQLYKMAGNSIVVACMDLIFENLFFPVKMESSLF